MGVRGQSHDPAGLSPGKRPSTHRIGDCVGPTAGLDGCRKSRLVPGFDPQTFQPVASCYTDYGIPAPRSRYTVIPRLTKIIRSGITFVSRNLR